MRECRACPSVSRRGWSDDVEAANKETEPASVLADETMVVCIEAFRPGYIAHSVEKGQWLRLDSANVRAFPEYFAVPLTSLNKGGE